MKKEKQQVKQEKAFREASENAADKKTAMKTEVYYSSVAYLQSTEDIKAFSELHKKGHVNKLLKEAANYDPGDALELNVTFKSPVQNKGDELVKEDKNYAVVYNNSVGGTYEVFRKVSEQEVINNIEQYGLPDDATKDVKEVAQTIGKEEKTVSVQSVHDDAISKKLKEYNTQKAIYPDAVLLFRTGDFYETYKEDAHTASKILGITLTRYKDGTEMAGFPYHALDTYLPQLVHAGQRVAIVDGPERGVIELVTPKAATTKDLEKKNIKEQDQTENHMTTKEERATVTGKSNHTYTEIYLDGHTVLNAQEAVNSLKEVIRANIQANDKKKKTIDVSDNNKNVKPTKDQQEAFVKDIKELMGNSRFVSLRDLETKEGVEAKVDDKAVTINCVHQFDDNISFAATVTGQEGNERIYIHPSDIRPEFYDVIKQEVSKAMQPQYVTANGEKVTGASVFPAKDDASKYLFYAKLDGVGLRPRVVQKEDVEKFANKELSVKDMMEKYYPTKIAKRLDKEQFCDMKLSDGTELTKVNVFKQKMEDKPHFGKYMLYAEMGEKKLYPELLSRAQLEQWFDRTVTKGQMAETVFGEQLHLKSAYEKYILPENVSNVTIRKANDGHYLISASLSDGRKTQEKPMNSNDLFSLFKAKTATKEQLGSKYLANEIKELAKQPVQKVEHRQGMHR